MAYTTINKSSLHFNNKLYTGNGGSNSITGVGFQPDFVWSKCRDDSHNHQLFDAVRGATKRIRSDTTGAETTHAESLKSFDSDGFTMGTQTNVNQNSATYVSWNWKANGAGSSNSDGTITSTVSANTTAGFSVGTYTANATAGATVGHGLGVAPDMLIVKVRNNTNNWAVYHESVGATKALYLDSTSGETTDGWMNNTAPSSSVFTLSGGNYGNASGYTPVFYAFAEKTGYSKFGSYKGNSSLDGTFIYTGFKPAWGVFKRTNSTGNWIIMDNKRSPFNEMQKNLFANTSDVEDSSTSYNDFDFLSNGIKIREDNNDINASGSTYIYMAFAEAPLVGTNNIPCTAR